MITNLKSGEVLVFGTNQSGFHGAGAAGFAQRGDSRNNWREDKQFLLAMNSPIGSPLRIGKYAVYGIAKGLMKGKEGLSYGIITITKPGQKRSVSLDFIQEQIFELNKFAINNPLLTFIVTPIGCGLAGFTLNEIAPLFKESFQIENIIFTKDFKPYLN